ncbi:type III secretion system inner rod subunit SctI [Paraburkholderia sp. RL17-373-BIF-A]|uniref:type III secretion system inner rod subunit SctI n=1 Tax=Paraburkholderia sp. RL17-373-BIF-A TaxID=3031629 RepID=UPI0038BBD5CD
MDIFSIANISSALAPVSQSPAATPSSTAQQQFADLLGGPSPTNSPDALLGAQFELTQMMVGTELTAKVAGSITQSINKLVNMQ